MLKAQIEQDLKSALLGGDKKRAEVLRGLKSAILYEEVAKKVRDKGLDDVGIIAVVAREVKKRNESAELYQKAGAADRAAAEQAEKAMITVYLPAQLSDDELAKTVEAVMAELGPDTQMGQIIGAVKQKVGSQADGGRIASMVKQKLQS